MSKKIQVALFTTNYGLTYAGQVYASNSDIRISKIVDIEFEDRDKDEIMQAKVAAVEIEIEQANNVLQKALQKKQDLLALEHTPCK